MPHAVRMMAKFVETWKTVVTVMVVVVVVVVVVVSLQQQQEEQQQQEYHQQARTLSLPFTSTECADVTVANDFDLSSYISGPWFVQQQAVTGNIGLEYFYCILAKYTLPDQTPTKMGYTILVQNRGQDSEGVPLDDPVGLCAYQPHPIDEPAKLAIAPCDLPTMYAKPYWVIAYEEGPDGYALVSAGQPTVVAPDGSGLCHTDETGGLWLFTRTQERNAAIIDKVRDIAQANGFYTPILYDVIQDKCQYK